MDRELVIESGLKKGDFRKLTYWNMFGKSSYVKFVFIGFFVLGILLFLLGGENTQLKVGGLFAAAAPFIALIVIEYNIFAVGRRGNIEKRTYGKYTFSDRGIIADAPNLGTPLVYDWKHVEGAYETKDFYLVFINKIQTITIRKEDLDEVQERELLGYVGTYVVGDKNHIGKKKN